MNRKLSKTVIITGRTTDNPNFQWYEDRIGEKFEVVKLIDPGSIEFYRCVDFDNTLGIYSYISADDCILIEDYRNKQIDLILN